WQRKALQREGRAYKEAVAWWKELLSGTPRPAELPFKRDRQPAVADASEGLIRWGLDPWIVERLDALARTEDATYFMIRLAAFVALLAAESGETNVIIGTYIANRSRRAMQSMLGFVTNLVILRFHCDLKMAFRNWLLAV